MDYMIMAAYVVALLLTRGQSGFASAVGFSCTFTADMLSNSPNISNSLPLFYVAMFTCSLLWIATLHFVDDVLLKLPVLIMMVISTIGFITNHIWPGEKTIIWHIYPSVTVAMHVLYLWRIAKIRGGCVLVTKWRDAFYMLGRRFAYLFNH